MATDYDAPRKTDEELAEDSLEELKARRADKVNSQVDIDEAEAAENPLFHLEAPDSGGHVGFLDFRRGMAPWSEGRVVEFLAPVVSHVHGMAVLHRPDGSRLLLATTNRGLHESRDDGLNWTFRKIDSPWQYTRAVVPRADHGGVVFLTNGNGPPGDQGRLWRSDDWGDTWYPVELPGSCTGAAASRD